MTRGTTLLSFFYVHLIAIAANKQVLTEVLIKYFEICECNVTQSAEKIK